MLFLYFFRDCFGLLGFHTTHPLATPLTLRFTEEPALDRGMQRGGHMLHGFYKRRTLHYIIRFRLYNNFVQKHIIRSSVWTLHSSLINRELVLVHVHRTCKGGFRTGCSVGHFPSWGDDEKTIYFLYITSTPFCPILSEIIMKRELLVVIQIWYVLYL